MDPTAFLIIVLYIALVPFIFHLLRYLRIEEIFKRGTPINIISLTYVALSLAISQLILNYFVSLFATIRDLI